jgi:hypothetical protein
MTHQNKLTFKAVVATKDKKRLKLNKLKTLDDRGNIYLKKVSSHLGGHVIEHP